MILIVDDDPAMLAQVCDALTIGGLEVTGVASAAAALAWARREIPELVLSDIVMPEQTGLELRQTYAREFPERGTPFVFLSSRDDAATIVAGLEAGADDYLVKPVDAVVPTRRCCRRNTTRSFAHSTAGSARRSAASWPTWACPGCSGSARPRG